MPFGAMAALALVLLLALSPQPLSGEESKDVPYDTLAGIDRYIRFDKPPGLEDDEKAILGGGDVKCDVCEIILGDIMKNVRSDRDSLLEAMEADNIEEEDIEKAPTDMLKHVAKKNRGCNRLFKDHFFRIGWDIVWDMKLMDDQNEETELWKKAVWAYARRTGKVLNETEIHTYSINKECVHYACEHTIAKHRDSLASFLAKRSKSKNANGAPVQDLIAEACRAKAKCEKRSNPSDDILARSKMAEREFQGRQAKTMELFLADQKEKKRKEKEAKKARKAAKEEAKKAAKKKRKAGKGAGKAKERQPEL